MKKQTKKKFPLKRVLAIAGLILITGLYAATIICALIDSPFAKSCLMAALFCTIVVPAVIYGYLTITKQTLGDIQKKMEDEASQNTDKKNKKDIDKKKQDG